MSVCEYVSCEIVPLMQVSDSIISHSLFYHALSLSLPLAMCVYKQRSLYFWWPWEPWNDVAGFN